MGIQKKPKAGIYIQKSTGDDVASVANICIMWKGLCGVLGPPLQSECGGGGQVCKDWHGELKVMEEKMSWKKAREGHKIVERI